jgi:thiamine monophosphate synthase
MVVGLQRLRQIKQAVSIPVVAIGGITRDNVAEVMSAGADAVAVINAVLGAEDVEGAARELAMEIERKASGNPRQAGPGRHILQA